MKILLTGASSDTGLKLAEKLIENLGNFNELILLSSSLHVSERININKNNKIKIINQNLLEPFQDKLKLILNDIDILIHVAWIRPNNPLNAINHNMNVIEKILKNINSKTKVIFLSSISGVSNALGYYGKSKFQISKILSNNCETSVLICGLIITDNKKTPFYFLKNLFEKLPFLIKFGSKVKVLYTDSNQVLNAICNKINNFEKGVYKLYNNEDITLDEFAKRNFKLKQKISIDISLFIKMFLLISKYLNYVPLLNKIVDKIITMVTIDKYKADELIKKGF